MEEMDFERRRELRRQKREEMRLEAERLARTEDDEEEAARERRRRARQERMKNRENEENSSSQPETSILTNNHSVTESVSLTSSLGGGGGGEEEDQALMERMAKREERRLRRMKEAMERQKLEGSDTSDTITTTTTSMEKTNNGEEERPSLWRRGRYRESEEEESKSYRREEEAVPNEPQEEEREEKPQSSYLREQDSAEEPKTPDEELKEEASDWRVSESSDQVISKRSKLSETGVAQEALAMCVDNQSDKMVVRNGTAEDQETTDKLRSEDNEVNERGEEREEEEEEEQRPNGGFHGEDTPPKQHWKPEQTLSRGSVRSPEVGVEEEEDAARLEAERKLEELKRRRNEAESDEFERMKQKQQEAESELEELKKRREERRKVLEEEERQRKQEEEQRKAREEEEKRRMKEEIEKRRAEAAEKRHKVDDIVDGEEKPFKCVSPRGSSLKIGERAEFLNKSAQKSAVKTSHSPVVSKIDNRLEQYTSAAQRENKESRSPRSGAVDLPLVTDIKNIKSMWEKGNVFSSPGGGSTFKEAAVMKTGVAGRINDWLNKTPESGKTAGGRPMDLKPVDVTNKRSLWENKASPAKEAGRGESKSVANGMGH
ncbi:caldesmon 1a isoform X1 [Periophthalmus magnuspinnatus]|uniref:caldesmon 1a isoform X1 n=1 Tax=Periophthalmus magnuspinnatus TaxID=409849 RepID=UPI002436851C|nr:caldesmon 1a isoform X1 [Periophthalmus magnuspinnatus]XP_055087737.1 caldesmon 1a isoform X1 [Periophthalmus magnuspinnatus]